MFGWLRAEAALASRWKRASASGVGHARAEDLHRHGPPQAGVAGTVDDAHAALAELLGDLEVPERLACHVGDLSWRACRQTSAPGPGGQDARRRAAAISMYPEAGTSASRRVTAHTNG